MVDVVNEKLIPLAKVKEIPWLPRRYCYATVYGWVRNGIRGVRLEHLEVGGITHTSEGAILRFFERLTIPGGRQESVTPTQARQGHEMAVKRLKEMGLA